MVARKKAPVVAPEEEKSASEINAAGLKDSDYINEMLDVPVGNGSDAEFKPQNCDHINRIKRTSRIKRQNRMESTSFFYCRDCGLTWSDQHNKF